MKSGRNDPCPCGSGKKYKKCCLPKASGATPERNTWRLFQDAIQEVSGKLAHYFHQAYGEAAFDEAWSAFARSIEADQLEPFDPQLREADAFSNWVLFTWAPDPEDTVVADANLHGMTPAQAYLARHGDSLTPMMRECMQAWIDSPWSLYRVEQARPDKTYALRDMITGAPREIYAPEAAGTLRIGDEAYAVLVVVAGTGLIGSWQPVALMEQDLPALDKLRELVASAAADSSPEAQAIALSAHDDEIRELYLLLTGMLESSVTLPWDDTDTDELTFHDLVFDIDSPDTAWEALKHLQPDGFEPPVIERDPSGQIRHASWTWDDPEAPADDLEDGACGSMTIDGRVLRVETTNRGAETAKQLVHDALGQKASLREETVHDIDEVIDAMADDPEIMAMLDAEDAEDAARDKP